jgi:hypothetical protein
LIFNDAARFVPGGGPPIGGQGWDNPELNLPGAWGITDVDQAGGNFMDGGYTDILPAFQNHPIYDGTAVGGVVLSDVRGAPFTVSSFSANIGDTSFHSVFGSFDPSILTPTEVVINAGIVDVGGLCPFCALNAAAGPDGLAITLIRDAGPPPGPTSIEVSKTASFDGRFVTGTISTTNVGENPAIISAVADSLEVHFPGRMAAPPLPAGSTPRWFKVADVPVASPGLIPVGETVSVDYVFDLCLAADFQGANAMRNAVAVTLANKPENARVDTIVTRSESFEPGTPECPVGPVLEDLSPCFAQDFWEFDVSAGDTVFLEADTVDTATAADLCFFGSCDAGDFFGGDDTFPCTFPPPGFSCPRDTFVASGSGMCAVTVLTCSSACADFGRANYSLTVQRDGAFTDLTLVGDDL